MLKTQMFYRKSHLKFITWTDCKEKAADTHTPKRHHMGHNMAGNFFSVPHIAVKFQASISWWAT